MSQFYTVSWFSAGVSSAVATRLAIDSYGVDAIIYIDIEDQHPDSMRFVKDCERWFGQPITILRSSYGTVENACRAAGGRGWINGPGGAACTRFLKKRVRKEWEAAFHLASDGVMRWNAHRAKSSPNSNHTVAVNKPKQLRYVWGLDADEAARAERIIDATPQFEHLFPLLDHASGNGMGKAEAHAVLRASGIRRPAMYDLGYHNNNCVGCVKGGMGYWNKIRVDFPEVFAARAKLERIIGASCIKGVFLDELSPDAGRHGGPIVDECGIFCEIISIEPSTERLTAGGQLTADTPQPDATQADAESSESGQ